MTPSRQLFAWAHVSYMRTPLSLSELAMTLTDESAIAAAAMMGDSNSPKAG